VIGGVCGKVTPHQRRHRD